MKAKVWKGVWALCVVAVTMASCDFVNKMKENATTTPSDTIIGANAGELDGKIDELLELAKAKRKRQSLPRFIPISIISRAILLRV